MRSSIIGQLIVVLFFVSPMFAAAQSLSTTFVGGNSNVGNMFDIVAQDTITITGFDINCDSTSPVSVSLYAKAGTYVGSETTPSNWTLLDTADNVSCAGTGNPTSVPTALSYVVPMGTTHALYLTLEGPGVEFDDFIYSNGSAVGNVFASNSELQILEGAGMGIVLFQNPVVPRVWNGTIFYSLGAVSPPPGGGSSTPESIPTLPPIALGILILAILLAGWRRKLN
ncbi:MAG: hypothetical protein AAF098_00425 [Pseudomonadota bacterium]